MTHDEIVEVIGEKFPGLSPTNPFNRRVVRGQTSFWIDNEKFKKFARVIRVKKEKPWDLKRVASDLREKTRMDIEKISTVRFWALLQSWLSWSGRRSKYCEQRHAN